MAYTALPLPASNKADGNPNHTADHNQIVQAVSSLQTWATALPASTAGTTTTRSATAPATPAAGDWWIKPDTTDSATEPDLLHWWDGTKWQLTGSPWVENIADPQTLITNPHDQRLRTFNIVDDGTANTTWPDRWQFRFTPVGQNPLTQSVRTGGFNEYGELRADSARTNTVAFRAHGSPGGAHVGPIFTVRNFRGGTLDILNAHLAGVDIKGALTLNGKAVTATTVTTTTTPLAQAAPVAPEVGDQWLHKTDTGHTLKIWDGTAWVDITVGAPAVVQAVWEKDVPLTTGANPIVHHLNATNITVTVRLGGKTVYVGESVHDANTVTLHTNHAATYHVRIAA
jgi:hypothetical protein